MGLKKELTPSERSEIIQKRQEGLSLRKIAGTYYILFWLIDLTRSVQYFKVMCRIHY